MKALVHAASVLGAACLVLAACGGDRPAAAPHVEFQGDSAAPEYASVRAWPVEASAPDEWVAVLSVHVGDTSSAPMLGAWELRADTLVFLPRFAPAAGVAYVARFSAGAGPVMATWTAPSVGGTSTTRVTAVYPSADTLPMNLLRMYVQFSAPMTTGHAFEHVRLYANGDSLVPDPFFTGGDAIELWDPDKTRLTILFDPGRIKRDLVPREQAGLPLQSGVSYRLVIDSAWRDGAGRPLTQSFEKRFVVGPMDRSLVRPTAWSLTAPSSGSRSALVIEFPEAMDHALLHRMLVVRRDGADVAGTVTVSERERRWAFVPTEPWHGAAHTVEVDTELEDLAGNNLRRLFDVAPGDTGATGTDAPRVSLAFRPR